MGPEAVKGREMCGAVCCFQGSVPSAMAGAWASVWAQGPMMIIYAVAWKTITVDPGQ